MINRPHGVLNGDTLIVVTGLVDVWYRFCIYMCLYICISLRPSFVNRKIFLWVSFGVFCIL